MARPAGPIEHKEFPSAVTDIDAKQGLVVTVAAVYGNVDEGNDRILYGAGAKTIAERGHRIKMGWQHDLSHPMGVTKEAVEIAAHQLPVEVLKLAPGATGGLRTVGKVTPTPTNLERLQLMESAGDGLPAAVDGTSIGFRALKVGYSKEDGLTVRNIKEYWLGEWSPVTLGMNEGAMVIGVKSADGDYLKALLGTFEDLSERIREALQLDGRFTTLNADGEPITWFWIIGTYVDRVTVCTYQAGMPDEHYDVAYGFGPGGEIQLGDSTPVEIVSTAEPKTASFEFALKALRDLKEGRVLSGRNKEIVSAAMGALRDAITAMEALLAAAEPADGKSPASDHSPALRRIAIQQQQIQLGRLRVATLGG